MDTALAATCRRRAHVGDSVAQRGQACSIRSRAVVLASRITSSRSPRKASVVAPSAIRASWHREPRRLGGACGARELLEFGAIPGLVLVRSCGRCLSACLELCGGSHESAAAKACIGNPLELPVDGGLQPLGRRGRCSLEGKDICECLSAVGVALGERGVDEAGLRCEVSIQRGLANSGGAGHGLDAGRADAAFVEQAPGCLQQCGADLRGGSAGHGHSRYRTDRLRYLVASRHDPSFPTAGAPHHPSALGGRTLDAGRARGCRLRRGRAGLPRHRL